MRCRTGQDGHSGQPVGGQKKSRASAPLNVVVSGAKLYNNKGKVVEQWEPYFGSGFDLTDPTAQHGHRVRIFFDALGRPQRTVNPDGTEQRVVYGVPNALNTPASFKPSPWERFTYDANDLAPVTHPGNSLSASHHWTPKSELIDALGRTIRTVEHCAPLSSGEGPGVRAEDVVMKYRYDIKGQLLEVRDPLNRVCFEHLCDTAGNNLWTEHLDSGVRRLVVDAQGKPVYSTDAKTAMVFTAYDALQRPTHVWAQDSSTESMTLRQHLIYGDQGTDPDPVSNNLLGKLWQHYDEAGFVQITAYDFKGNPLEKVRQVIADTKLTGANKYVVDWSGMDVPLETKAYITTLHYDALNRVRKSTLPANVDDERWDLEPTYNRAGALQAIALKQQVYVRHIAYNAKGQRVLLAMGNDMMTRYAYDPFNFRLLRIRSERYAEEDHTYTPDGNVQQDLGYLYDVGGNIIGIRDKAPATSGVNGAEGPGDLLKQFAYDPLNRLLTATGRESTAPSSTPAWDAGLRAHDHTATNTYTRAYQYDKLGNVLQEQHTADGNPSNSFTKTFQYHATQAHNRLVSFTVGGTSYHQGYDANGNLLVDNTSRVYQWGYDDRLRYFSQVPDPSSSKLAHYLYDASGTRVKKVVNKPSGLQEVTVYIDGVYEHSYTKNSGTLDNTRHYITYHVLDGRSRLATWRVGNDQDATTPALQYNLEDHLGTSSVVLDLEGKLINREEYYPFGDSCFGGFGKKRYRYVGKEKDGESGLYYYGARYYAPWICRFISVDPLAREYPMLNPYNYASNSPVGDLDLDGLQNPNQDSKPLEKDDNPSGTPTPKQTAIVKPDVHGQASGKGQGMGAKADDQHEDGDFRGDCGMVWQCQTINRDGTLNNDNGWVKLRDHVSVDGIRFTPTKENLANQAHFIETNNSQLASAGMLLSAQLGKSPNPATMAAGAVIGLGLIAAPILTVPHPDVLGQIDLMYERTSAPPPSTVELPRDYVGDISIPNGKVLAQKPHILYQIYGLTSSGSEVHLKYGITGQDDLFARPISQIAALNAGRTLLADVSLQKQIVHFSGRFVMFAPDKATAHNLEQMLVDAYWMRTKSVGPLQGLPLPTPLKSGFKF